MRNARLIGGGPLLLAAALLAFSGCRESDPEASSPAPASETPSAEPAAATPARPPNAGGPAGSGAASPTPAATPAPTLAAAPDLSADEERRAIEALRRVAREGAADPGNPWALAHGVLAFGADFRTRDGENALGRIVSAYLEEREIPGAGGGTLRVHAFPREREGVRVEPHRDLVLKNAIERDAFPEGPFGGVEGAPSRVDLVRSSQATFEFRPGARGAAAFPRPDDVAWSVQAYCQEAERAGAEWVAASGMAVRLDEVAAALIATLEDATRFLAEARARGAARVQKRRQGIFAFTCGGAHLYQAAEACAAAGFGGPEARERVREQTALYLWRGAVENALYDEAIAQAPRLAALVVNQRVKFLGHLLESLGKAERDGLWRPTAEEAQALAGARRALLRAALQLEESGVYRRLAEVRAGSEQFYLDLVGDACHALRGLEIQAELGRGGKP